MTGEQCDDETDQEKMGTSTSVVSHSPDDDWLNVDADGTGGTAAAVAHVLRSVADTLEESPDGARYDFTLEVEEQ
jgi:hypothetical protein